MSKYIFVTGGVVSGLGKGITAAALGRLLKCRGFRVAAQKLDPYLNVDPGTMNPFQHGEVFVTEDGAETDLDLGHYERFIDEDLNRYSNLTTGRVYGNVIDRERQGGYLGNTVQIIPHITGEIKKFIYAVGKKTQADVVITEIGGTIGDIEGLPFVEAARQVSMEVGKENCLFIHVTLVPYLKSAGEHKSKPTQHSVKQLQGMGISPDIIVLRCDEPLSRSIKPKIALFCNVDEECVIENRTLDSLYKAPIMLENEGLARIVCKKLCLGDPICDLTEWNHLIARMEQRTRRVRIGIVGKYVELHDAYLSVVEALNHAGIQNHAHVDIAWINAEQVTGQTVEDMLSSCDGILIPGGFGDRGIEGMIHAAAYAREHHIPYLGICLGMQIAVISYARDVLGLPDANSKEFDEESAHLVIDYMPDQNGEMPKGGTLRLGAYPCMIRPDSRLREVYGKDSIAERHRHRFELNNDYRASLEMAGMCVSGTSPDGRLAEAVELPGEDFYIGVQFHPEFKSRPNRPHPLFCAFVEAAGRLDKAPKPSDSSNAG